MSDATARESGDRSEVHGKSTPVYEEILNRDPRWALSEGSRHFDEDSAVFKALRNITRRLNALQIPYVVVGGMALFRHGVRRFTEDVDILVTRNDLKRVHDELEGLGYLPPFPKSKNLRDTDVGVRIEFLTSGDYPGDGKPKPVSFPDPSEVGFEAEGIRYIKLPKLVELKLASGMTHLGRLRDLADVLELIKTLNLPSEFAEQLDPFVRGKYQELWQQGRKRYVATWRAKSSPAEATSLEELTEKLRAESEQFNQMLQDGVTLEHDSTPDRVRLVTTDPEIAEKYGLVEESEYWEREDEETDDPDHET